HCTDGHAYPSHPVAWHLSQSDRGDDPKPSSFHKRYRSSYETPLSFSSPASSPTLSLRKRYRGTSKLIKDTEVEGTESETESEELEDEGPGSESEEAASEDQQQQAVPVKDTATNEPLGLGYKAARRRALELAEGTVPSTYEVGQSSRSVPVQPVADETPTPRLPVRTTWEDPEDGIVYVDIEGDMPPVRAPVQTPVSIEWSSGSLPISPAPLTRLDALPPTLFEGYGRDFTELFARSRLRLLLVPYGDQFWPLRPGQDRRTPREQLCGRLGTRIREIHDLRMQHAADQRDMQEVRDRATALERRMDRIEEYRILRNGQIKDKNGQIRARE
ncbi:hypothetical protein Tco_1296664, partial [Tanacetum coccineum]